MKKDLLVTLADGNYVEQVKQVFSSVYWNAGWTGDYLLLASQVPKEALRWFKDKGILVKECDPILMESKTRISHAPLSTLSKFYLFTPEFKRWKNILFLDGDVIVRGSLDALTQIEGFAAARILNLFGTSLRNSFHNPSIRNRRLFRELESKYDLSRPAFNSGLMAFCTDIISGDDFDNIMDILFHFKDLILIGDETVLNIHYYDKWQELSQVYNVCPNYEAWLSGCAPVDLKGIVSHTYSCLPGGKHWNLKSTLRSEWISNLDKADMIDLAKPQPSKRTLSKAQETLDDVSLKNLHKAHRGKACFFTWYAYLWRLYAKSPKPVQSCVAAVLRNTRFPFI